MHPDLHRFLWQLAGAIALALSAVIATAFLTIPYTLQASPGDAPPAQTRALHFT